MDKSFLTTILFILFVLISIIFNLNISKEIVCSAGAISIMIIACDIVNDNHKKMKSQ